LSAQDTSSTGLSDHELEALARLEDELGRGESVKWDEPKTIRGYVARTVETVTVKDYSDSSKTVDKKVITLRTAEGLAAIWEGPTGLEKLFEAEASQPVIVAYRGEKVAQESGRTYKAFDVVTGDKEPEPAGGGVAANPADDDITF
jgi:hypothetical protein